MSVKCLLCRSVNMETLKKGLCIEPVSDYVWKTQKCTVCSFGTLDFSEVPFLMVWKMKNIKECAEFYNTLLHKDYIFTLENGRRKGQKDLPRNFFRWKQQTLYQRTRSSWHLFYCYHRTQKEKINFSVMVGATVAYAVAVAETLK